MTTGDTRSLLQDVVAADTAAAIMGRGVSVVTHGNCWLTPLFKDIGVGGCVLQSVAVTCDSAASRLLGLKNSRVERSPRDLCHMFAGRAFTKALQLDPNPYGISGKAIGVGIVIFPIEEVKKTEIHVVIWNHFGIHYSCDSHVSAEVSDVRHLSSIVTSMALPLLQATVVLKSLIVDRPAVTPTVCSLLQHVESLLSGNTNLLLLPPNGQVVSTLPPGNRIIFTGSFNPFHIGHRALMREAESQLGSPTVYAELGVTNADKPGLSAAETLVRAAQFAGRWPLLLSRTALFIDKARLYPGSTFLVGTDTVVRLLNTKYYNNSEEEATRVLGEIQSLGCKFLVAGRKMDNGYQTLTTLLPTLPMQQFHGLLSELPFRLDISSTELRRAGNKGTR